MWLNSVRVVGIFLMFFSLSMLSPVIVSWLYGDGLVPVFIVAFFIVLLAGFVAWALTRKHQEVLRTRDGFLITVMIYLALGVIGALPIYLSDTVPSFTDAAFESLSGLTTTGATVLSGLDSMPKSILFYRQQLQWLGGMGIILLAVALLPILGVGGMQLYRAEVSTPDKDSKLTPRIAETARSLWLIYLTLTVACALSYAWADMSWFDAICHSFSTVAIGGFSTHDLSIGWFDSSAVEGIAMVFMLLCATNFGLHFVAWHKRSIKHYFRDPELRFFILILLSGLLVVHLVSRLNHSTAESGAWFEGLFQTVSIATTTGFTTPAFFSWPLLASILAIILALVGGCAGSVAGGMKAVRILLIFRQGAREIFRLVHPNAIYHVKLGHRVVDEHIVHAVWGFFTAFVFLLVLLMLIVMGYGLDFVTAFSAVGATISNLGPGLGQVSMNYQGLADPVKWILCLSMLLGRLEIYTLLVLFAPPFWRQ